MNIIKPNIKWNGGKGRELKTILPKLPQNFNTYVEPFFGGGALYWEIQPPNAIINDINSTLINYWTTVKNKPNSIKEFIQKTEDNEKYYYQLRDKFNNKELTLEEQAGAFYYFNRTGFNGLWRVNKNSEYNVSYDGINKRDLNFLISDIDTYSKQLKTTEINNDDFRNILNNVKFDSNAFVFLDPPYLDCKTMYTESQDFMWIYNYIKEFMSDCKCKVMLITKTDDILIKMFSEFNNDTYNFNYSANNKYNKKVKHMLITNY